MIELGVPARHNVLNATAALVTGIGLGHSPSDLRAGLESFSGTRRRFDFKGTADGVRVYDDYAHHPTEIAATLRAMRDLVGDGRLVVAFQAHHYYRTACSRGSSARRSGSPTRSSVEVSRPARTRSRVPPAWRWRRTCRSPPTRWCSSRRGAGSRVKLVDRARPGDVVMTLGAGDIAMIGAEVLDLLRAREGDGPVTLLESAQRFGAVQRTRRTRRWVALVVGVALVAAALWVGRWFSTLLSVKEVRVLGAVDVSVSSVRQAAAVPAGIPLARVDTAGIAERVGAIPRVASVEVRRGWPDVLVVVVTERTPIAVTRAGASWTYLDATGARFGTLSAVPAGMPRVERQQRDRDGDRRRGLRRPADAPLGPRLHRRRQVARRRRPDPRGRHPGAVGQRRPERAQGGGLASLLTVRARSYDVSAPDFPPPGERRPRGMRPRGAGTGFTGIGEPLRRKASPPSRPTPGGV